MGISMIRFFTVPIIEPREEGYAGTSGIIPALPVGGIFLSRAHVSSSEVVSREVLIDRNPNICGGKPVIRGTRITVSQIVELYHFLGWDVERILNAYPHLTVDQILSVVDYYATHTKEIDDYIKLEKEID